MPPLTPEINDPNRETELERLGLKEVTTVGDTWEAYLKQSVAEIVAQLPELDTDQLTALLEAEQAGKDRKSLVEAILEALTKGE